MTRRVGAAESGFDRAKGSGYWRAEDARVVLDAWADSGQSVAAFAREHGLQRARLHRWRRRLQVDEECETPLFWPVEVTAEALEAADGEMWRVELGGGVCIAVPCSGGAALLAETLVAVREGWAC